MQRKKRLTKSKQSKKLSRKKQLSSYKKASKSTPKGKAKERSSRHRASSKDRKTKSKHLASPSLAGANHLPDELYDDILPQRVVIFAGAGTTTESRSRLFSDQNFYESIKEKCRYPKTKPEPSFPDLM